MYQFRTIENYWIHKDWLRHRMLFLSGPRQVGKTTLVKSQLCTDPKGYFNWDSPKVRKAYRRDPDFFTVAQGEWICFDEIHKRQQWKNILKGIYDIHKLNYRFVITGSARLDYFRKSGDSLVGRYFETHLFPLNIADFRNRDFTLPKSAKDLFEQAGGETTAQQELQELLDTLLTCSGFPEPFYAGSESFWKRWSTNHQELIIREDLRDLTKVIEIDKIEALEQMIKPHIGQTVSNLNLANDLETSHTTVRRWLMELSKVQLIFPVNPYSRSIRRAYRQEKKWYYYDWCNAGVNRFENYIATSLLRATTLYQDRFGDRMDLRFIRTHDQTEVDFLILRDGKPYLLIEAKEGTPEPTNAVYRFSAELNVPCIIVTRKPKYFTKIKDKPIYLCSASKLMQVLP